MEITELRLINWSMRDIELLKNIMDKINVSWADITPILTKQENSKT